MSKSKSESNVVEFKKREEPHIEGEAFCMQCGHEWRAVSPLGVTLLECPECHTKKGLFKYPCVPPDDIPVLTCDCGNQLFLMTDYGPQCPNCGNFFDYDDD